MYQFGPKLFGYFWARIFKSYCHIWNQHPQICQKWAFNSYSKFWYRVRFFWRFGSGSALESMPPWITAICSTIWEEVNGTLSLTTQCQNVYTFWWDIFRKWCINQLLLLNTSSFLFPQAFFFLSTSLLFNFNLSTSSLLINFIIIYHTWFPSLSNLLATSICFQVSMLLMLVTMYKVKFTLWKTLIMFIA